LNNKRHGDIKMGLPAVGQGGILSKNQLRILGLSRRSYYGQIILGTVTISLSDWGALNNTF